MNDFQRTWHVVELKYQMSMWQSAVLIFNDVHKVRHFVHFVHVLPVYVNAVAKVMAFLQIRYGSLEFGVENLVDHFRAVERCLPRKKTVCDLAPLRVCGKSDK
jgi:hypothetical protein